MGSPPAGHTFNRGLLAKLILAVLAGPFVWAILFWVFDMPLARRLFETDARGLSLGGVDIYPVAGVRMGA